MMDNALRRSWVPAAMVAALVLAAIGSAWPASGGGLGALVGAGPRDWAMLACGYCAGAGIAMFVTDTWVAFLSSPSAWGKIAGCATACYTMLT